MRQGRLLDLLSAAPPYTPPRGLQTDIFHKTFYTQSSEQTAQDAQDAQNAHTSQDVHTAQNFTIALG